MTPTMEFLLRPIRHILDNRNTEDVCINGPDNVWVFANGKFHQFDVRISADDCLDLAIVAAAARGQNISADYPILTVNIGDQWRLIAIIPPAVTHPVLTIRRGSDAWPEIKDLANGGLFNNVNRPKLNISSRHGRLRHYYETNSFDDFLSEAVAQKKTIVVCGENASGKTHLSKAMIGIIPGRERLITIEDSPELQAMPNQHHVSLLVNKDHHASATALVAAALRMRIGRLFLQEVRYGEDAIAFLVALQTGHAGAITTIHAKNCAASFERLFFLLKGTDIGGGIDKADIMAQLKDLIDIVVHAERTEAGGFAVDEIWWSEMA